MGNSSSSSPRPICDKLSHHNVLSLMDNNIKRIEGPSDITIINPTQTLKDTSHHHFPVILLLSNPDSQRCHQECNQEDGCYSIYHLLNDFFSKHLCKNDLISFYYDTTHDYDLSHHRLTSYHLTPQGFSSIDTKIEGVIDKIYYNYNLPDKKLSLQDVVRHPYFQTFSLTYQLFNTLPTPIRKEMMRHLDTKEVGKEEIIYKIIDLYLVSHLLSNAEPATLSILYLDDRHIREIQRLLGPYYHKLSGINIEKCDTEIITLTPSEKRLFAKYDIPLEQHLDKDSLKKLYRKLQVKIHPDKGGNENDAKEMNQLYERRYRFGETQAKRSRFRTTKKKTKKTKKTKKSRR